jgi:uncharacterized protein (DUF983 family)
VPERTRDYKILDIAILVTIFLVLLKLLGVLRWEWEWVIFPLWATILVWSLGTIICDIVKYKDDL